MMWLLLGIALAKPVPTLHDLGFLAGHWRTEDTAGEEVWTSPTHTVMVGAARMQGAEGKVTTEVLRIEAREDGIFYVAHPSGQAPVAFKLTEIAARRVVFENPTHDFPQRITYFVPEGGGLAAKVEARKGDGWTGFEMRWRRVVPEAADRGK